MERDVEEKLLGNESKEEHASEEFLILTTNQLLQRLRNFKRIY